MFVTPAKSRNHEDKFRCPQCDRIVTVKAGFRREETGMESLVRFECTMEGMCGSPVWDPCPMYMAYMERTPEAKPADDAQPDATAAKKKWTRGSLKDAW
ncbi:MAG TPA: hypothetical protein VFH88_11505 [Candidatus Krumholzibacteria bacterium]|nr:hypothetical protein [Candidatus Krumholzibacteria bacterium]